MDIEWVYVECASCGKRMQMQHKVYTLYRMYKFLWRNNWQTMTGGNIYCPKHSRGLVHRG